MKLFYISAKVTLTVAGISGPFIKQSRYLVREHNAVDAATKFTQQVRQDFAHMQYSTISFEYVEITSEI